MNKITQDQAVEFLRTQGYILLKSTVLKDFNIEGEQEIPKIFIPLAKEVFIKEHLEEVMVLWSETSDYETFYELDDWEECLIDTIGWSETTEKEYVEFCKEREIDATYEVCR